MRNRVLWFSTALLLASLLGPHSAFAAEPYTEGWDNGLLNGWDRYEPFYTVVYVVNSGGNPDGYLNVNSAVFGFAGAVTFSPVFTGNYVVAGIDRISVDVRFDYGAIDGFGVWIFPGGWGYELTHDFSTGSWRSVEVDFNPLWSDQEAQAAGWYGGVVPFSDTMSDVDHVAVAVTGPGELQFHIDNFGISVEGALFSDGFELGDTSAWSDVTP